MLWQSTARTDRAKCASERGRGSGICRNAGSGVVAGRMGGQFQMARLPAAGLSKKMLEAARTIESDEALWAYATACTGSTPASAMT